MTLVNNDLYLEAAKADFTNFQKLSRLEWLSLKRSHVPPNYQYHNNLIYSLIN